ncbi:MAG: CHAP domain-containing protein [Pseudomonadota bacterium]
MYFRVNVFAVKLREEPNDNAANPAGICQRDDILRGLEQQGDWWRLRDEAARPVREGFIRAAHLQATTAPVLDPNIDVDAFYQKLTFAARANGANRDYLFAVAHLESDGVKNVVNSSSGATGPFQFLVSTWADLTARHGAETGVTEADITNPSAQAIFGAIYAAEAQASLTEKLKRVPTPVELYLAHLLGRSGAAAVLSAGPQTSVLEPLEAYYAATTRGVAYARKVVDANPKILKTDAGDAATVKGVKENVAVHLAPGAAAAAEIAARLGPPPSKTPGATAGEPPWMTPARAELAKGVVEDKAPGGSNPIIEGYHATTSFGRNSDNHAWCASFVSFCMTESQNADVINKNIRSARAADWKNWGYSTGRPVKGSVGITKPLAAGASGHVGFVVAANGETVTLLGANQTDDLGQDSVCEKKFDAIDFVDFRWIDYS